MRLRYLLFIYCFFVGILAFAQSSQWIEQAKKESIGIQIANTVDKQGNLYTVGLENSTVVANPGAGIYKAVHNNNIFVGKTDTGKNAIWKRSLRGVSNFDYCEPSVALDSNGNIYVAYNRISVFNAWHSFILKLDTLGNTLWTKWLGDSLNGGINVRSVTIDKKNEVCVAGFFWGNAEFKTIKGSTNLVAGQKPGVFVCKIDAEGNYRWVQGLERTDPDCTPLEPQQTVLNTGSTTAAKSTLKE